MSIGRVRYKLNKSTSKVASNSDGYFNLNLESQIKLLPPGEINRIVNVGNIFNSERESVTKYRVISTISPIFSNVLFNLSGNKGPNEYNSQNGINYSDSYGYQTFDGFLFKNKPYPNDFTGTAPLNYLQSLSENLKEINGWFGFYDPDVTKSGFCGFYDLEPTRNRFDLNSSLNTKNWEITITYPYSKDENHYLVNGGLLVTSAEIRIMGGVPMVAIGSVVPHNLNQGDRVRLTNMPTNGMNGDYVVIALGLDNGDSKDTFFVVEIDPTIAITGSLFTTGRIKRLYFGNEVEYYFRKFKKINSFETKGELTKDSYECYPLAFSQTIYGDQNYQLVFNDDIDIEGLVDNLGRPLSELYITLIKNDSENTFTKVISGLDLENYQGNTKTVTTDDLKVSNIRKMHTISPPLSSFNSHIPLESDVRFNNIDYYGDLCEYSKLEVKETILKNVMHRFNTVDREITQLKPISGVNPSTISGPRNEGYIYQPHYQLKIRNYSNYIEQGDNTTAGIPDYSENLGDGRYIWRDLLPIGDNDGQDDTLDYPFVNGSHHLYNNLCFTTKRQDPFGLFGLQYNTTDIPDPFGFGITDNFQIKDTDDVC
jgi:hypothetical protein